jgi:hypothetical protein
MGMHLSLMLGPELAGDRRSMIAADVRRVRRGRLRPRRRPRNPLPDVLADRS